MTILTRPLAVAAMLIVLSAHPAGYAADHPQAEPNGSSSTLRDRMNREHAGLQDFTATAVIESRDDQVLERIGDPHAP